MKIQIRMEGHKLSSIITTVSKNRHHWPQKPKNGYKVRSNSAIDDQCIRNWITSAMTELSNPTTTSTTIIILTHERCRQRPQPQLKKRKRRSRDKLTEVSALFMSNYDGGGIWPQEQMWAKAQKWSHQTTLEMSKNGWNNLTKRRPTRLENFACSKTKENRKIVPPRKIQMQMKGKITVHILTEEISTPAEIWQIDQATTKTSKKWMQTSTPLFDTKMTAILFMPSFHCGCSRLGIRARTLRDRTGFLKPSLLNKRRGKSCRRYRNLTLKRLHARARLLHFRMQPVKAVQPQTLPIKDVQAA